MRGGVLWKSCEGVGRASARAVVWLVIVTVGVVMSPCWCRFRCVGSYEEVVNAIIRPPRAEYEITDLGAYAGADVEVA